MLAETHKVLPNNEVISEVKRLLDSVERVVLPVKGNSMLPFIIGGRESVELVKPGRELRPGDVVLAWVNDSHYVVHRIIAVDGDRLTLMGDGNLAGREHCRLADVVALAEYVVSASGRRCHLYSPARRVGARLWFRLLPVRRWLLAIVRRLYIGVFLKQIKG